MGRSAAVRARLAPSLALHLAVLLFGFAGLFGKWLALPAVWIVLGRTSFAAATLLLVLGAAGGWRAPSVRLLANGVLLAAHWVTFFEAIRVASVAIGLLGFASFPLFVLLIERLHTGETLTRLAGEETGLVLTVDCGITAVEEVAHAKELGLEVVVTDHHRPGERLPDCPVVATRPSEYPFPELCGTGVVYKLAQALGAAHLDRRLDLVALATVADVVPLLDENRGLVAAGFYTTPIGMKDIGYVGNEPLTAFEGPPPAVLKKLGIA